MSNLQDESVDKKENKFLESWKKIPWKKVGVKLLFPHTFIIFLMFNITLVGLLYIFLNHLETNVLASCFYAISFYTLVIVCVRIPRIVKRVQNGLHSNKYTHRYLTDQELRINFSMYRGLIINMVFAVFKIVLGLIYHTPWLYAMAGYNTILSLMRFIVVARTKKKGLSPEEQEKRATQSFLVCGWLMLILNIAISVIIYMVVVLKQTIVYHEIVVIALAAFTFYCFTMAVINVVKYRKKDMAYSAIKRIDLAKAIVSVFTLQVAMITQFGGEEGFDSGLMNTLTGTAVTIAVNTIAAFMIARVTREEKAKKEIEARGE